MLRVIRETKPRWVIGENVEGIVNINEGMVLRQVLTDLENEGFKSQCIIIPASGIGAWHQRKRIWIVGANVENANSRGRCWEKGIGKDDNIGSTTKKQNNNIESSDERCRSWDNKISINVPNTNTGFSIRENKEIQSRGNATTNGSEDVSNADSWLRRGRGTELKSGDDREWGFYIEKEKQTREHIRCKTIGCNAVLGKERTNKTWWQIESELCGIPNGVSYELDKDRSNRIKSLGNSIVPQIARQIGLAIMEAEIGN
jgi:site-specific DNA-cytosine methylase